MDKIDLSKREIRDNRSLLGRYKVLELLGEGRFGKVYKVEDLRDGKIYALKEAKDVSFSGKLLEEAQQVLLFDHPNLVKLFRYHISRDRKKVYLIYEFCDGGDLAGYVKRKGTLEVKEALPILKQVANGLAYLHEHGYIHMDIKPENVLRKFTPQRELWKLGDFGLLKPRGFYGIIDVKGTVGYIAPEVFRGEIHRSSDIFSLGCLFYFMLKGVHPFHDTDKTRELIKNKKGKVKIPPEIRGKLRSIFEKMINPDPMRRFRTAGQLLKELRNV